jgi:acid phosphatase class B
MVLKDAGKKISGFWVIVKRVMAVLCVWGLIFSVSTIARLGVAFDYDDGLAFTSPAYQKADAQALPLTDRYWSIVNNSYDLDRPKILPYTLAWLFRLSGFRVAVITGRPAIDDEALAKDWRHLVPHGRFIFTGNPQRTHIYLAKERYLLYFGASDADIEQARLAHVYPIRILRSSRSYVADAYHPRTLGDKVLPLSQYSF